MTVYPRLRMRLTLEEREVPPQPRRRQVERSDVAALGDLMLAAYRGTVDDEGEALEDAVGEIGGVLDGSYGPFASDASFVVEDDDGLVGASLVAIWDWEPRPLLLYLVVRPEAKRRGVGTALLLQTANALAGAGHPELDLFVTETNEPAVALYRKLGFEVVERIADPPVDR